MRLPSFAYHAPHTLDQALKIKRELGAQAPVLAGGTDLIVNLKHQLSSPAALISLRNIKELKGIQAKTRLRDHTGGNHPDGDPEQ